jgi:hypothetical protein
MVIGDVERVRASEYYLHPRAAVRLDLEGGT